MVRRIFFRFALFAPLATLAAAWFWSPALWALVVIAPVIAVGIYDLVQTKHPLLRIYPVIGHGRYLMEELRPEIQQYFVESNTDGTPFDRERRSVIYQRSKRSTSTLPFGTQGDVSAAGYEWMAHSMSPRPVNLDAARVMVGGSRCKRPYSASRLNVSAMSFGSLSANAIRALNRGAKSGGFAHNTGEGGISNHHLREGGDLVWQIGTAYFGCRDADGNFDRDLFAQKAKQDAVKMVEIKLSQGAKPGHGGILPAEKLTEEIAEIRGVPMGRDVLSPPAHSAFDSPRGLLQFVDELRQLSGGKPVGFKLCVGYRQDLLAIVKAMLETRLVPDFITVDGAEGGTGAAPMEFSNSVGMPMREGLSFVHQALVAAGLRDEIRIFVAGKIATGFDMVRVMALGADACNAARPMMLAMGCIQARKCNTNHCPVGIATQDPARSKAINVAYAASRVQSFHDETVHGFLELLATAGLQDPAELTPSHIHCRMATDRMGTLADVYPAAPSGCLRNGEVPPSWENEWRQADIDSFGWTSAHEASDLSPEPKTQPVMV